MGDNKMGGAKGIVYLKSKNNLSDFAKDLEKGLIVPEFYFKSDQDPPHDIVAMTEVLGFEIWLEESEDYENFNYKLTIETMMEVSEQMNMEKFDLSPWLSRFIERSVKIETKF